MAYDPYELRPGDIILVEGHGVLGAAIRWSTGSPFTHACIVQDSGWLIEGLGHVQRSPTSKYERSGWAFRVLATEGQRRAAVAAAAAHLGAEYGYAELLLDVARFDLHWTVRPHALAHLTCSGLVAVCYASAGVRLTYAPWPAPADLGYTPVLIGSRPWEAKSA